MCAESQCLCSLVNSALCEDGSVFNSVMVQIYASSLVSVMNNLRDLESIAKTWGAASPTDEMGQRVNTLLGAAVANCAWLRLRSAWKQLQTIHKRVKSGTCENVEFSQLIAELRRRILEDLDDRVFYCITDTAKIDRFFKHNDGLLVAKKVDEVFDSQISERFGNSVDDLIEASKCYVAACYTASVFHMMRVVEVGVMEVAQLARINDPKPSWGAVLSTIDKLAFRTEYANLPDAIKPHRDLLRELSNEMHAIQYAWRNKVNHIETKLVPVAPIDQPIASEIMTAVQAFMRSLAERLPPKSV